MLPFTLSELLVLLEWNFQCFVGAVWRRGVARRSPRVLINCSWAPQSAVQMHLLPRRRIFKGAALLIDCLPLTTALPRVRLLHMLC